MRLMLIFTGKIRYVVSLRTPTVTCATHIPPPLWLSLKPRDPRRDGACRPYAYTPTV